MENMIRNLRVLMGEQSSKTYGFAYLPEANALPEYVIYWEKSTARREYAKAVRSYGLNNVAKVGF